MKTITELLEAVIKSSIYNTKINICVRNECVDIFINSTLTNQAHNLIEIGDKLEIEIAKFSKKTYKEFGKMFENHQKRAAFEINYKR